MGSLNLDQNAWYQINVTRQSGQSLVGTPLYTNNGTQGAVFYQITNTSSPMQSWQFWPYNSSVYLLRCRDSGPNSYLAASSLGGGDGDPAGHVIGDSVPVMNSYKNTDASMFWVAAPWGDGTYYLYNLANGSNWRINVLSSSLMTMDSDITAPQVGEQFVFSPLRAINDNRYSTYHVFPTSQTTTPTASPSTAQTGASSASAPASTSTATPGGLSTAVAAGIGVAAGIVGVAILGFLGWYLLRRRSKGEEVRHSVEGLGDEKEGGSQAGGRSHGGSELADTAFRAEAPGAPWRAPVELAGDTAHRPLAWS